jgi:vacuolar-type H+-ATPase catalytic subunit A/Vma1
MCERCNAKPGKGADEVARMSDYADRMRRKATTARGVVDVWIIWDGSDRRWWHDFVTPDGRRMARPLMTDDRAAAERATRARVESIAPIESWEDADASVWPWVRPWEDEASALEDKIKRILPEGASIKGTVRVILPGRADTIVAEIATFRGLDAGGAS